MGVKTRTTTVANKSFDPEGNQRTVLDVFLEEYQVNPRLIRDITGLERQRVNEALNDLENAGWIEKRCRGLYRLRYDGESYVDDVGAGDQDELAAQIEAVREHLEAAVEAIDQNDPEELKRNTRAAYEELTEVEDDVDD